MAADPKTPADSPQLAHFKSREKELVEKLKRLESVKPEPGFDSAAAIERNKALLKEVRDAMKDLR